LARAVLAGDFDMAQKLAEELIPNEAHDRAHKSFNRVAGRRR
jgi:hypothetical protein